jgi:hypothetical protein
MHAKDLFIYKSSHRQTIKAVSECLPDTNVKPPLALIIKPIYTVDGSTFMVAPKKEEVLLVFDLVCKEEAYCLYALFATINIVPQEQIICLRWVTTILKQS